MTTFTSSATEAADPFSPTELSSFSAGGVEGPGVVRSTGDSTTVADELEVPTPLSEAEAFRMLDSRGRFPGLTQIMGLKIRWGLSLGYDEEEEDDEDEIWVGGENVAIEMDIA